MNKTLTEKLGRILDRMFGSYSDKIKITANVLVHDWTILPPDFYQESSLFTIKKEEVEATFSELDPESADVVLRFLQVQQIFAEASKYPEYFFFNTGKLFKAKEKKQRKTLQKQYLRLCGKSPFPYVGPESILFHHGLLFFPEAAIRYLSGGIFIDAGACYGDSTLIFSRFYGPGKIYAFEPSDGNREKMLNIMRQLQVPESVFELEKYGLGDKAERLVFQCEENSTFGVQSKEKTSTAHAVEIITLDDFAGKKDLKNGIRLIKADLEGMGLAMLKGAEHTIRRNRPVLLLSIYHTREELFGIYQTLQNWNLNYEFAIRSGVFPLKFGEITLLGYPAELNAAGEKWKTDDAMFKHLFESAEILLKN